MYLATCAIDMARSTVKIDKLLFKLFWHVAFRLRVDKRNDYMN